MSILEWIFGWNHEEALEKAQQKCLSQTQLAVDAFHGEMLHICGYKEKECGDCWNEIPPGEEYKYGSCPNFERRQMARKAMKAACQKILKDFDRDMDEAFINSFNFAMRPLARCYVASGRLQKAREEVKKLAENVSKTLIIAFLAGIFLAGPMMAVNADARRGYSRSIVRMFSRKTVVRPVAGPSMLGMAAGAAAGTMAGEMMYDAVRPEEEQSKVPVNDRPQVQERPFNAGRGDCGCQGN